MKFRRLWAVARKEFIPGVRTPQSRAFWSSARTTAGAVGGT